MIFHKKKIDENVLKKILFCSCWGVLTQICLFFFESKTQCGMIVTSIAASFLPIILCVLKAFAGERIKFSVILFVTLAAACGIAFYLKPEPPVELCKNIRFYTFFYAALMSLYIILLGINFSDNIKKLITSFYITILALPLLMFFSFDIRKLFVAYHVSVMLDDTANNFFNNRDIQFLIAGFVLKCLFTLGCCWAIQCSLPVLKFKNHRDSILPLGLAALLMLPLVSENANPLEQLHPSEIQKLNGVMQKRKNPLSSDVYRIKNNIMPGLYFLIIGESHEYKESCNILLKHKTFFKNVCNDSNYIVFKNTNAITHQAPINYGGPSEYNVANMLSFSSQPQDIWHVYHEPNILDLTAVCKIKSLFLHNAGKYELSNQVMRSLFFRSDFLLVTNRNSFNGKYDGLGFQVDNEIPVVLRKLYADKTLDGKNSFMVIKPLGLHPDDIIIPEEFQRKHKNLNEYQCGLLYWDNVLQKIVSTLQSFPETRAIVYCSDHAPHHKLHENIVMFVYLAPALQKQYPGLKKKIETLASKPYRTIEMHKLLLEIMNISVVKKEVMQK